MKKVLIFIGMLLIAFSLFGCVTIGKSAYDIAVENGFVGTEAEWLESLKGKDGASLNILDIYNAAVDNGYKGELLDFVKEYFSDVAIEGKSAYDLAVEEGYEGTLEEWLASLKGQMGMTGPQGEGIDLYKTYQKLVELGEVNCSFLEFVQDYLHVNLNTSNQEIISKALLSAVKIVATNDILYDTAGNPNPNATGKSGAGVVYKLVGDNGAYIITNYHVVYDSEETKKAHTNIYVNFIGDQYLVNAFKAKFIGGSATFDIAVLYIEDTRLKDMEIRAVDLFDSNKLVAGTPAIAIGNPQGDGIAVTEGIVSVDSEDIYMEPISTENVTLNADGEVGMRVIRIDTPVNSGNSGGGLFNNHGELIGIVNAKIMSSTVVNIGYAIPSNIAVNVTENLIRNYNGSKPSVVSKCLIGITITINNSYSIFDKETQTLRLYEDIKVMEVSPTSALFQKVLPGDLIRSITFGGKTYEATRDFVILDACLNATVGTSATVTVERNGKLHSFEFIFNNSTIVG